MCSNVEVGPILLNVVYLERENIVVLKIAIGPRWKGIFPQFPLPLRTATDCFHSSRFHDFVDIFYFWLCVSLVEVVCDWVASLRFFNEFQLLIKKILHCCSDTTKDVLIASTYVHLKCDKLVKYASVLPTLSRCILLSGPAGTTSSSMLIYFILLYVCSFSLPNP